MLHVQDKNSSLISFFTQMSLLLITLCPDNGFLVDSYDLFRVAQLVNIGIFILLSSVILTLIRGRPLLTVQF